MSIRFLSASLGVPPSPSQKRCKVWTGLQIGRKPSEILAISEVERLVLQPWYRIRAPPFRRIHGHK